MSKLIEVSHLTKKYKDGNSLITALDDINFYVNDDEDLAIVGPSGSGKTTLLEIVAGLNKPSKGKVVINGRNVHQGSDKEVSQFRNKTIGFVFQLMHLQDYFSALENVTLPLIANGTSRRDSTLRAEELMVKVGLKDRMKHYPKQLSGGEMQRVAIARALANRPRILMADEPTGKLDRQNAENVMEIFDSASRDEGISFVLITHDERIARRYKKILRLDHGRLINSQGNS